MMDVEVRNKAVVEEMFAAVARDGLAAQAEFFALEVIDHGMRMTRVEIRAVFDDIATTFPDVRFRRLGMVAEADWVTVRCRLGGTHEATSYHPLAFDGLLAGVAPTGKRFLVQQIHMFRLEDGRIVEHWANRDDVGMLRQLGLFRL